MANASRRQKALRPPKAMHNDTDRDISTLTGKMVAARIISAKGYNNKVAYKYWRDLLKHMDNDEINPLPAKPVRKREKRVRGFHTKYADSQFISADEIRERIKNAAAWVDTYHEQIWTNILHDRFGVWL